MRDAAPSDEVKPPLVDRILAARGWTNAADRAAFLDPKLTHLHDPSLIPDLDKAAERLLKAVRLRESIVVYGDYDVDGITATAILFHTLRALAPDTNVTTYVPHRIDEGYGLNVEAIQHLAHQGAKVIVSVDCGITALAPALTAKACGVDLIITDHHHPPKSLNDLPDAFAVVHPRRPDSTYPFGDLSGAGVAYKLAWRLATLGSNSSKVAPPLRALLVELLAFAALGTIADIVPLVGENRVIARFGLVRARHSPFVGLRALVDASGLATQKLGELEVGFRLGPRLNAAGRMGHAREAVELFTTADVARAVQIARQLSDQNDHRRAVEQRIVEAACAMAEELCMTGPDRRAIVLAHREWHAGVVGIVCSRLVERYHRPTILMQIADADDGPECHGSARSIDGFDLHAGLSACAEYLDSFGGHTMAAGLHMKHSNLPAFVSAFTEHANSRIPQESLSARVTVDCDADWSELTPDSTQQIEKLAPFGAGNPNVRLLVRDLVIAAPPKLMGDSGKHLSLTLRAKNASGAGTHMRTVAWNWGQHANRCAAGRSLDIICTPRISAWSGRSTVEPELRDIRLHER